MTCWEVDQHHARDLVVPGSVVVDVGACQGEWAGPCRDAGAAVLCIEILEENCAVLRGKGLATLRAAAGSVDGRAMIVECGPVERTTGCHAEPWPTGDIPMLSLRTIVDMVGWIDALKVDIEGGEYGLLLAAPRHVLQWCRYIAVETHVWTVPGQARMPGIGERPGRPYVAGDFERLIEKLDRTHHVTVEGDLIYGPVR